MAWFTAAKLAIKAFFAANKWAGFVLKYVAPAAVVLFCAWWVNGWREEAAKVKGLEEQIVAFQAEDKRLKGVAKDYARKNERLEKGNELLSESLKYEIGKNSVYRSCKLPGEFVQWRSRAIKSRIRP